MGKYLDLIRSIGPDNTSQTGPDKNLLEGQSLVEASVGLVPGACITWQLADGKTRGPATVDFLHTDPDGTVWAFVTLPDGRWTAVNIKHVIGTEERKAP